LRGGAGTARARPAGARRRPLGSHGAGPHLRARRRRGAACDGAPGREGAGGAVVRLGLLAVAALAGCQSIVGIVDTRLRDGADGGGSDFSVTIAPKSIYATRGATASPVVT